MNSRERVLRVLKQEEVDRLPRHLWYLPGVIMFREAELAEVLKKYPNDIEPPVYRYGHGKRCTGNPSRVGMYTDAWGSVWHVKEEGVVGEVKEFPLAEWTALDTYKLPWELLYEADMSEVNISCARSDKFILAGTETRPFERMQFLRGTENLFMDLAYGVKEIYKLRDMLHEFNLREMEMWANTDVDGVSFMDDWGTQKTLLISPRLWREFFKPLYKDYCDILHKKGKFAFFHSDGNIEQIYPDLIEIGVDAVNSQLFCMDIERLGELYAGKITFWGEIDRQHVLPFGTKEDVKKAVRRVAGALIKGKRTGVIAQCEWGNKDPKENIETVFETWDAI
ncbi:MAG: methyltransferase [Clostridiaceae bacterium]|nr:methyltransferase [Clostridiaceae bacterium]